MLYSARGKPEAENFSRAQDLAHALANQLDAADKARQYSVELTISTACRTVQDLPAIFDEVARIIHLVADALPNHAANVGQVIVSPARAKATDPLPMRRIVRLHGG